MLWGSALVIDASVAVKWLNCDRELFIEEANDVVRGAIEHHYALLVSDVTLHEVFNALIRGKQLTGAGLHSAIEAFFLFPLTVVQTNRKITSTAALIAERDGVTFYDAIYCAIAYEHHAPLITANPKHQRSREGIIVIPLDQWFEYKKKVLV